jgi:hypothetical protein
MKLSIFPQYGALNSKSVFEAFTVGARKLGHEVVEHDLSADVYVIWSILWHGRMKQNKHVWDTARSLGKNVIVLEVGGLKRGHTWKIGINGINNLAHFANHTNLIPERSKKLGIFLKPWTMSGEHILICGQHSQSDQWMLRKSADEWALSIIDQVRQHSQRPIILRPHPRDYTWAQKIQRSDIKIKIPKQLPGTYDDFDFEQDLQSAWAVINPSSNTGVQAIIHGVPSFVDQDSLALPVGNTDFSQIENPLRPNRDHWLETLCHTEWTESEIAQGIPLLRILTKKG